MWKITIRILTDRIDVFSRLKTSNNAVPGMSTGTNAGAFKLSLKRPHRLDRCKRRILYSFSVIHRARSYFGFHDVNGNVFFFYIPYIIRMILIFRNVSKTTASSDSYTEYYFEYYLFCNPNAISRGSPQEKFCFFSIFCHGTRS